MERYGLLTLPGLEFRPFGHPARSDKISKFLKERFFPHSDLTDTKLDGNIAVTGCVWDCCLARNSRGFHVGAVDGR
jgi:hypothetical protein